MARTAGVSPLHQKAQLKAAMSAGRSRRGTRRGGGQEPIYDPVRFPIIAHALCRDYGFTNEQLASVLGDVHFKTLERWITENPEFKKAIRSGKDLFDNVKVENALLKRALGFKYTEKQTRKTTVKGKDANGVELQIPAVEYIYTEKEVIPDTKAIMAWLTNRDPERWKMVVNVNTKGEIQHNHNHQHNHSGTIGVADLSVLNSDQLRDLRNMVALTQDQKLQIGHTPVEALPEMQEYHERASKVIEAEYKEVLP